MATVLSSAVGAAMLLVPASSHPTWLAQRLVALMVPMGAFALAWLWFTHRQAELRRETREIELADESMTAGHWQTTSAIIAKLLSAPMLSRRNRADALLIYLQLLRQQERFDELVTAGNKMLAEGVPLDDAPSILRLQVLALLQGDCLVDADRRLEIMRRLCKEGGELSRCTYLVLVMVRDATANHPEEVLKTYHKHRTTVLSLDFLRADALAAWAAHVLGQTELAARLWWRMCHLKSPKRLVDLFPDLAPLAQAYPAPAVPAELAPLYDGSEGGPGPAEESVHAGSGDPRVALPSAAARTSPDGLGAGSAASGGGPRSAAGETNDRSAVGEERQRG